jgi:hypothetical protein
VAEPMDECRVSMASAVDIQVGPALATRSGGGECAFMISHPDVTGDGAGLRAFAPVSA